MAGVVGGTTTSTTSSSSPAHIHSLSFNQDNGCFSCATSSGFRVYNSDPFKETVRFLAGGMALVSLAACAALRVCMRHTRTHADR
jgi:hypothetical protein